ncbi:hypothetical protein B0T22DRAFT_462944 [Podospora appendiculata]|uniref:Secreted protein n=1 Tax=Podospora appendiculata TaxID=314037 RepID=A0AAE0XD43_9PEZI|nr:hypothetical protein B0T22DRAFT_462944 [Podospora appendiculata]
MTRLCLSLVSFDNLLVVPVQSYELYYHRRPWWIIADGLRFDYTCEMPCTLACVVQIRLGSCVLLGLEMRERLRGGARW